MTYDLLDVQHHSKNVVKGVSIDSAGRIAIAKCHLAAMADDTSDTNSTAPLRAATKTVVTAVACVNGAISVSTEDIKTLCSGGTFDAC